MLDAAANTVTDDDAALELTGMRSVLDAYLGRTIRAAEAARAVLTHPKCSPNAMQLADWGLAVVSGGLGRLEEAEQALTRIDARVEASEIGLHQAVVVVARWLRALLLTGLIDQAETVAQRYRQLCRDIPGTVNVMTSYICANVALFRGQVHTATRWYRQAIALVQIDPIGWSFRPRAGLTSALSMAGEAASARHALTEMTAARHWAYVFEQPELKLVQAWVAAAEGTITQAISLARQAAEMAASQDQPAVELYALHTAVCFGDCTTADRLTWLATQVDGPRALAAAAHATALAADDGTALHAVSLQLEQMGALLLAADAAAQAAAAYTRQNRHGSALTTITRARHLAQICEGARTPALAALAAPPTLTTREREIAVLAARGLSNRQIAQQLMISVRTVENHLYRACTKLGTSDRAALASLLHGN